LHARIIITVVRLNSGITFSDLVFLRKQSGSGWLVLL